ncbi:MAG: tetratricopeptide repeat protein [Elusimicrobia bacterium]|nr:tetratricopeptide repeat protein [Elusimicrobiota bacterium]
MMLAPILSFLLSLGLGPIPAVFSAGQEPLSLCRAHREGGVLQEAIAECSKAVEADPKSAVAYHELGVTYSAAGKLAEAVSAWESSVQINPQYSLAHYDLGLGYYEQGRVKKAVQAYQAALAAGKGKSDLGSGISLAAVYANLGVAQLDIYQRPQAEKSFRKASALDPKGEAGGMARQYLREMMGTSQPESKTSPSTHPQGDTAERHTSLARQYFEQKRYGDAVREFRRAVQANPGDPNGHISLAGVLLLQNTPQSLGEAEEEFQNSLKLLKPEDPLAAYSHSRLGDIAWIQKKPNLAAERYRKAASSNPQDSNAHIGLARYYESKSLWFQALESYRKGLELDSSNRLAREGIKRVQDKAEEPADLLAEMKERKILEDTREEFTPEERERLQLMRQAEEWGAVEFLRSKGAPLQSLVVERKKASGRLKLFLTPTGLERYEFFRSQDSVRAFESKGVEAKYVFYLRDQRGEPLYDSSGRLTAQGERVYQFLLNGQKKWLLPTEPVPVEPGSAPQGEPQEVTVLRLAGFEQIHDPELDWLIRETGCPQDVLEKEFTLKVVKDAMSLSRWIFLQASDMLMALIAKYRAGDTAGGMHGTNFFGSEKSSKLCR